MLGIKSKLFSPFSRSSLVESQHGLQRVAPRSTGFSTPVIRHLDLILHSLSGPVDILVTTMRIRDTRSAEIVVCYGGRSCDGRSRTLAVRSHRPASLPGGAPALPKPFEETPIRTATVVGHPLLSNEEWVGKRQFLASSFCHGRLNGSVFNNLAGALHTDMVGRMLSVGR